jgi:hypothetical protein
MALLPKQIPSIHKYSCQLKNTDVDFCAYHYTSGSTSSISGIKNKVPIAHGGIIFITKYW